MDFIELYRGFQYEWKVKRKEYPNKKREAVLLAFVQRAVSMVTKESMELGMGKFPFFKP